MTRADRAQAVLDALGTPAPRPKPQPVGIAQRLCRYGCGRQLVIAHLASGQWAALEREPSGDMVIIDSVAITAGAMHNGLSHYIWHRCQRERA